MKWTLGLDLGSNSIGWWAFESEQTATEKLTISKSLDGGVRIFPDGREPSSLGRVGDSMAVARRLARGARRNREHKKLRFRKLVSLLIETGLLPRNEIKRKEIIQSLNPYESRSLAASGTVAEPYVVGRALFAMGQRRGYQSNRKEASDEEGGKLRDKIDELEAKLSGLTLGQFLWQEYQKQHARDNSGQLLKNPAVIRFKDDNKFFPSRQFYCAELKKIRHEQFESAGLSDDIWDQIAIYILEQRPLKPIERGRCSLFIDEPRHWADTPIGHEFRIYQELNNLAVINADFSLSPLNKEQYEAALGKLMTQKGVTFGSLRKLKDVAGNPIFPRGSSFNLEGPKRKGLNGHALQATLMGNGILSCCEKLVADSEFLNDVFECLHMAETDAEAIDTLKRQFGLSEDVSQELANIRLGKATASLSRYAMELLVEVMKHQGLQYWEAVEEIASKNGGPLTTNRHVNQKRFSKLPYYGEAMPENMLGAQPDRFEALANPEKHFGRINNPSVHVALNQIRKLVNELTDRFGSAPCKINLELTRDLKLPKKLREELERSQARNEKRNTEIREELGKVFGISHASADEIKKYKLWEELGRNKMERTCVYSGEIISAAKLFSGDVELEHILPFSRTLDNGIANLTLSMRWANRLKGNMTPFEAFAGDHHAKSGILWQEILRRVSEFPENKQWRFAEDALVRFEKDHDFLARQLTDTAYMSRISKRYLGSLDGVEEVITLPGRLTAMVRGKWRLNGILSDDNRKSREDHRHHAVDAAVIGLMDRSLLQKISNLSGKAANGKAYTQIPPMDLELEKQIRARVPTILPSFKPDHGMGGKIFKETAYGFTAVDGEVVTRKPLISLKPGEVDDIRDDEIKGKLKAFIAEKKGGKLEDHLSAFSRQEGIKRVRIIVKDQTVEPMPSAPYKGYTKDSYLCCDIWKIPPKKKGGNPKYEGVFWTYADVKNQSIDKLAGKPHPAAKFLTRLFKNDLIETGEVGKGDIWKVAGFSTTNNKLDLRIPTESNSKQKFYSINVVSPSGLRRLHVTVDGRRAGSWAQRS